MKYNLSPALVAAFLFATLTPLPAQVVTNYFWDTNGTTSGAGGSTPTGTWGTDASWSTNVLGTGTLTPNLTATATNAALNFAAGTDASGTYTVTVNGTQNAFSLKFEDGAVNLSGGALSLYAGTSGTGDQGLIQVNSTVAATVKIDSDIVVNTANGSGTDLLKLVSNKSGGLEINGDISASAGTFALRYGGTGDTAINGTLSNLTDLQQGNTTWAGALTIGGNQSVGAAGITFSSSAGFSAGSQLVLGTNLVDTQTWGKLALNNANGRVVIRGTVTATNATGGAMDLTRGELQVAGLLNAGTANFNGSINTNFTLRLSDNLTAGTAVFTNITTSGAGTKSIIGGTGGTGTLIVSNANAFTVSLVNITLGGAGTSNNALNVVKDGSLSTLILSNANTYSGSTTVRGGTLRVGNAQALGDVSGGTVVLDGGRLELVGGITVTNETISLQGLGGNNQGALQSLSGSNTWAGTVELNPSGGTPVRVGAGSGATLVLSGPIVGTNNVSNGFAVRNADTSGTVVMSGSNSFVAPMTVFIGTLRLAGGDNRLHTGSTLVLGGSGAATLDLGGTSQEVSGLTSGSGNFITNSGGGTSVFTVNSAADSTFAGRLLGNIALIKGGASTLSISNLNSYTGLTTISNGTLRAIAANVLPSGAGTGNVALNGGAVAGVFDVNGFNQSINGLSGTGGAILGRITNGAAGVTNTLTLGNNDASANFAGRINGAIAVEKVGSGTQTLSGTNTFTGNLTIQAGVLEVTSGSALGTLSTSRPVALNGGTFRLNGGTISSDSLAITNSGSTAIESAIGSQTLRIGGPVTGTGNINIGGTGVVAFGKNSAGTLGNSYAGTLDVQSGATLDIRNPDSLGATSAGTSVRTGGTLLINPFAQPNGVNFNAETIDFEDGSALVNRNQSLTAATTNRLSGAVTTAGTLGVSSASPGGAAILAFNGGISGAGGIVFGGAGQAGTYQLNAGNSYLGDTVVSNGTLVVNGSIASSSSLTVLSGGTLGGTGLVGSTLIDDGGRLAPGTSPGILTVTNDLTLSNTSQLDFEIGAITNARSYYDAVVVQGSLTLDGVLNVSNWAGGFGPTSGTNVYALFDYVTLNADNGLELGSVPTNLAYGVTAAGGQVSLAVKEFNTGASFSGTGLTTTLVLSFGTNAQAAGVSNALTFDLFNFDPTDLMLGLSLTNYAASAGPFSLAGGLFSGLAAGSNQMFTSWLDLSAVGTYSNTFVFDLGSTTSGFLLSGVAPGQTLTLILQGDVVAVPEPGSVIALLAVGASLVSRRRRRAAGQAERVDARRGDVFGNGSVSAPLSGRTPEAAHP